GSLPPEWTGLRGERFAQPGANAGMVGVPRAARPPVPHRWGGGGVGPRRGLLDPTYTQQAAEVCRSGRDFARPDAGQQHPKCNTGGRAARGTRTYRAAAATRLLVPEA